MVNDEWLMVNTFFNPSIGYINRDNNRIFFLLI